MRIRNKLTGQIHEVMAGTLYDENTFEEVKADEIAGKTSDAAAKDVNEKAKEENAKKPAKTTKSANKKKGEKKNEPEHK